MKQIAFLLTFISFSFIAFGQSLSPLNWTPGTKGDKWLLQQQWASRIARTTFTFKEEAVEGQVLTVIGDSILWQPSYGFEDIGRDARWIRPSEIQAAKASLRPAALMTGTRTWLATVYGTHSLNLLFANNLPQNGMQSEEAFVVGAGLGVLAGATIASIKTLDRMVFKWWDRASDQMDESRMLRRLGRFSVYRKGNVTRNPFWELRPRLLRLRAQLETGHIDYPAARSVAALNLPSGIGQNRYPNTRYHTLSLGYALDGFTQVGVRFSPSKKYSSLQGLFYPYLGDVDYRIQYGPQWGIWAARDLMPKDHPHVLRTFFQIGGGAFAQQINLSHSVSVESYTWESGEIQMLGQSGSQQGQLSLRGLELFVRAGYRIHPNVSLITTLRHQWARESGRLEPISFNLPLPEEAEYTLVYYQMVLDRRDLRSFIIQTGLEFSL